MKFNQSKNDAGVWYCGIYKTDFTKSGVAHG